MYPMDGDNRCLQAVIFDFDYTLADSSRGAVQCINFALDRMGLPAVEGALACKTIGLSLEDTYLTLTGNQKERAGEFARLFIEHAEEVMIDLTSVFDWVPDVLRLISVAGLRLGIVSTKYRRRIEAILEREGLRDCFEVIIGGEDVSKHKPHPEGLLAAVQKLSVSSLSTLYVGDSVVDARVAESGSVPFVAVLSGVTPRSHFEIYPAIAILEDLRGLPALLQ